MFLHHVVTIFLYGQSFILHRASYAAVIMFLHDWADISTQFVRCFNETKYNGFALFWAVMMTISWGYTRLYVFPQVIYNVTLDNFYSGTWFKSDECFMVQLVVLQILHIYWFYVLIKSFVRYISKGEIKDL